MNEQPAHGAVQNPVRCTLANVTRGMPISNDTLVGVKQNC